MCISAHCPGEWYMRESGADFYSVVAPRIVSSGGNMVGICAIYFDPGFPLWVETSPPPKKHKNSTLIAIFVAGIFKHLLRNFFIMNSLLNPYFWQKKNKTHLLKRYLTQWWSSFFPHSPIMVDWEIFMLDTWEGGWVPVDPNYFAKPGGGQGK